MTPEQIAELERLEREATPGEWGVLLAPETHGRWSEIYADGPQRVAVLSRANAAANGEFITATRNALPSLLSSARDLASLRAKVAALAGRHEHAYRTVAGTVEALMHEEFADDLRSLLLPGGDAKETGR